MTCMGHCEIKHPIHEKTIKKIECIHTNGMLENGLMHLY
jgi:hypothetical protein